MLAGTETQSYAPVQYIAGDAPAIATENATLGVDQRAVEVQENCAGGRGHSRA